MCFFINTVVIYQEEEMYMCSKQQIIAILQNKSLISSLV